jgi:hypothetical protein
MHLLTNSLENRLISVPRGFEVSADFQDRGCQHLRFAKLIFFHFPLAAIYIPQIRLRSAYTDSKVIAHLGPIIR